ncbi:pilus assembly protein PilP [Polycyclovorans algicola]|uniref:pilus assembly protein PilP n=1 Tax=Polycyclovorans algicola TaxID=616992 RepID=UPI0004A781CA|nr:pilus assembly protein PilP [Polycyclovorans algicola]
MIRRPTMMMALSLLAAIGLSGCSRDMQGLETYVAEVKSRQSRQIEPIPQVRQYESYVYMAGSRPDPFIRPEPVQAAAQGGGPRPDINRPREPLEEFPLDALRMVGVIDFSGRRLAMVRAPDGVIHRVGRGNHMGQNYGEIGVIEEGQIALNELIPDGFGGWIRRPATLALTP